MKQEFKNPPLTVERISDLINSYLFLQTLKTQNEFKQSGLINNHKARP